MDQHAVSAAILAGGFSSRMGQDKAELVLDGIRLIERQCNKLKALGIDDIMLSGYCGSLEGARTIPDIYPHRGPLSGVHACLCRAQKPACLVISVDVPLIPCQTLAELIHAHEGGATVLYHGERPEPLLAVYDCSLAEAAETVLHSEKSSMMRFLSLVSVKKFPYSGQEALLMNCNTPEDFERIRVRVTQKNLYEVCL